MNESLDGQWVYRSFRHEPIEVIDGQVQGQPNLAIPWSPPGLLEASTGSMGEVKGTLTFAPGVALEVSGRIIPATEKVPAAVELVATGLGSVNRLKGHFIPGSDQVVGTILAEKDDPGRQPNGTVGPFVLFPKRDQSPECD